MGKRLIITDQAVAPALLAWMKERIGPCGAFDPEDCRTIAHAIEHDDGRIEILCVVALNRWTPFSCEGNIASDMSKRWMTRDFAFAVYDFVFRHAGKTRFNFTVSVDNAEAIEMHERLGHRRIATLEDAFGEGRHALLFGLTRGQWKAGRFSAPSRTQR